MILQQNMISILVHILVLKLYCAQGKKFESKTETAEEYEEERIVHPSGFAYRHISNHRPEIVYFSDQTTYRVDTAKDSKLDWHPTTPHTTTPKTYVKSELKKRKAKFGSSESDSIWSKSSNGSSKESSESKSSDSDESRSKSSESESESNESSSNESKKHKSAKLQQETAPATTSTTPTTPTTTTTTTTTTSTTTAKPITFPPKQSTKKQIKLQNAIFNQLPGPPLLRAPLHTTINGYQTYEPYAENHLLRPPPPSPYYRESRPYRFAFRPQASRGFANYYRPHPNSPYIHKKPLTGFFRFPVYRRFYVASKPKEPPPQPPPFQYNPSPKKHHKSKEETKESSEEEGEEKEHQSHSEEEEEEGEQFSKENSGSGYSESAEDSDEEKYDKSSSYAVHESHEEKDGKKYENKGESETGGHKHGHKSSEKKDEGANDSIESGFMKEEGVKFNHENRKRKGFNSDKGYKSTVHFGNGNKGSYDEEDHSDYLDKQNDKKENKHEDAKDYGQNDHKYRDDKGGKFNEQKLHKKGAKTTGYHNIFHKDEFKKVHTFYDDADAQGKHKKFEDHHEQYDQKKGSSEESGKHDARHKSKDHSKNGNLRKGHGSNEDKAWSTKNSKTKSYSKNEEYSEEDGHKKNNHEGYKSRK